MTSGVPRALPAAVAAVLSCAVLSAVVGCAPGGGDVEVAAPRPSGQAAEACRELAQALPRRVQEQERATLDPQTPYAAAWGDPAIVLRCGVRRPAVLRPGSPSYDPTSDAVEVNGVSWLLEEPEGGSEPMRFTTTERAVYVEVTVPDAYAPEVNPLVDLAAAIDAHIPPDAPPAP